MTRQKSLKFLLIGIILISGCATKAGSPPSFASPKLEDGVNISHPDQIRKETDTICVFPVVFPPQLLVECVGNGYLGTWKLLSIDMRDPSRKIVESFVYFKKGSYEKTPWGLPLLEAVTLGKLDNNKNHRYLLANRDGMVWLFSPLGKVYSEDDGYDSQKFEEDPEYRDQIFQELGMSMYDIFNSYRQRNLLEGLSFGEIKIDSQDWKDFEKSLLASMPYEYTMPEGNIVASAHKKEQIQALIKTNPGLTGWQRFLERMYLPVVPGPEAMGLIGISQLLNHAFKELTGNPEFKGYSANSKIERKKLAGQFKFLIEQQNNNRQP